jgi:hypothetical protein
MKPAAQIQPLAAARQLFAFKPLPYCRLPIADYRLACQFSRAQHSLDSDPGKKG